MFRRASDSGRSSSRLALSPLARRRCRDKGPACLMRDLYAKEATLGEYLAAKPHKSKCDRSR